VMLLRDRAAPHSFLTRRSCKIHHDNQTQTKKMRPDLVKRGIGGALDSMEGKAGLFKVYLRGEYDAASLTADLGCGQCGQPKNVPAHIAHSPYDDCGLLIQTSVGNDGGLGRPRTNRSGRAA